MNEDLRPAIYQIGQVHREGNVLKVSGWGLQLCQAACNCHRMPPSGCLKVYEGTDASLGLAKYSQDCPCCHPWTFEELSAIVADLAKIQAAPEVSR